ncbi:flagellar motor protein MotA [Methylocella silvestris]|uniref:Flagellar motor protein MotA n=1 Tax=Methylocella silvestris TaxID=199596 RepID=A0A2J7THN1_METSI|nr:flagellar motor protein MotA [Methylocella silvestris]PNG26273.1 flagellar motor protein MotA [Methylocella silvestris]
MDGDDRRLLSRPVIYVVRMLVFLILVGFCALILYRQIATAFLANPALNGLILAVLALGILLALRQVLRLFREANWANALLGGGGGKRVKPPTLLAPVAQLFRAKPFINAPAALPLRAVLDTIGARLDESRDTARYLTGLLVFLGLLGTFWGLLETVGSIGGVIKSMQTGSDAAVMFDDLKSGLSAPIAGMSISFTSSLFGLAGSLVLGFLDLQAGHAQNRFFTELEDALTALPLADAHDAAARYEGLPPELSAALQTIAVSVDQTQAKATSVAVASLADGVQALVQHMRSEQQIIRDWVEAQAERNREVKDALERLAEGLKERG